ncbi:MAG: RnfABCDGE type electron transport complex subunit D [Gammaproteobacteria bacterium]|jgi:Na+-translocating ferredoxin:NAD+ oxidoreductase subunit D|nr:RnfABCDGE type electron transport complex subunit D [Gammaproteobacteria bacterium]MBU0769906.1 RnfABCDGE type electron transport complex subunit D [Gammaproteobacteria bacterium]MBU0856289.1 RnfABCDGE type electron transport complex subunit D [Gammaproteobacteria bacterium]MBU1847758.1 RnfABCDGE type electron transport complex subunit D [Gammaproteobacteria bacterium]
MNDVVHASPHALARRTSSQIMGLVMLALLPATLAGFWHFGWPAFCLWLVCIVACVLCEAICLQWSGRRVLPVLSDGSAALTGWLLALSLPPWAPWWLAVLGSAFAIVLAKQVFGGLGCNVFNPAMVGRTILLVSFPVQMTQWVSPLLLSQGTDLAQAISIGLSGAVPDAYTSASLLGHVKTELGRGIGLADAMQGVLPAGAWLGGRAGSLGETSSLLILLGGGFLVLKRVIGLRIPLGFMAGLCLPAAIAHALAPDAFLPPLAHLLSGGAMLGAFFIATDYVTSPSAPFGQWIFAVGAGLLTWLIRTWGGYPEGVGFAVLLMNAATPLLDMWARPRIFGRSLGGKALPARRARESVR